MADKLTDALAVVEAAQKDKIATIADALKATSDLLDSDDTKRLFPQGLPPNLEQIKQWCLYQATTLNPALAPVSPGMPGPAFLPPPVA